MRKYLVVGLTMLLISTLLVLAVPSPVAAVSPADDNFNDNFLSPGLWT